MLKETKEKNDLVQEKKYTTEELEENSKVKNQSLEILTLDERENLIGFFGLLLEIDRRANPHLYKPVLAGVCFPMQLELINK